MSRQREGAVELSRGELDALTENHRCEITSADDPASLTVGEPYPLAGNAVSVSASFAERAWNALFDQSWSGFRRPEGGIPCGTLMRRFAWQLVRPASVT